MWFGVRFSFTIFHAKSNYHQKKERSREIIIGILVTVMQHSTRIYNEPIRSTQPQIERTLKNCALKKIRLLSQKYLARMRIKNSE